MVYPKLHQRVSGVFLRELYHKYFGQLLAGNGYWRLHQS